MKKILFHIIMTSILLSSCNQPLTIGYAGEDLTGKAHIVRDKYTKAATLNISTGEKWEIYSGSSLESIELSAPLTQGEGIGIYNLPVPDSIRSYFLLVTESGKAILSETHLPMTGGYNFRDLGGMKTKDGRYVKWGKILRSDDLASLTEPDLTYLASLPLHSIVDFRTPEEVETSPDKIPQSVRKTYKYPMTPGNLSDVSDLFSHLANGVEPLMEGMYVSLVTDTASIEGYRKFFALLQDERQVPLLFHCSAGKDRTGMGTALIYYALGVDEDSILNNYLESNRYLADKYGEYLHDYPQLKPLFEVRESYLRSGIRQIKEEYGSVEHFLQSALGVDLDKFRQAYLY